MLEKFWWPQGEPRAHVWFKGQLWCLEWCQVEHTSPLGRACSSLSSSAHHQTCPLSTSHLLLHQLKCILLKNPQSKSKSSLWNANCISQGCFFFFYLYCFSSLLMHSYTNHEGWALYCHCCFLFKQMKNYLCRSGVSSNALCATRVWTYLCVCGPSVFAFPFP